MLIPLLRPYDRHPPTYSSPATGSSDVGVVSGCKRTLSRAQKNAELAASIV
jgi:hypothetical protein